MRLLIVLASIILVSPLTSRADENVSDDQTVAGAAVMGHCDKCLTPMFNAEIDKKRADALRVVDWITRDGRGEPPPLSSEGTAR
jgi:hypothetical protein